MRWRVPALLLALVTTILSADQTAVTADGKPVILKDDGTWTYVETAKPRALTRGKWQVSVDTNPIDDTKTIVLALKADAGEGPYGAPVVLVLRYQSKRTEAYISWKAYLGGEDPVVTARWGTDLPEQKTWSKSTDSTATFYAPAIDFIQKLINVDRFVAKVTPYNENPITAIFDARGLRDLVAQYEELKSWDLMRAEDKTRASP